MATYTRKDMLFNNAHYNWIPFNEPHNHYYTDGSDGTILNRINGCEILYFINHLAKKWWGDNMTISQCQKIDRLIRYNMPDKIHSHLEIENWLLPLCLNNYDSIGNTSPINNLP